MKVTAEAQGGGEVRRQPRHHAARAARRSSPSSPPAPTTTSSWPRAPRAVQREYQKHGYFEASVHLPPRAAPRRRVDAAGKPQRRRGRGGHLLRRRGARAQGAPRRAASPRSAQPLHVHRRRHARARPASRPSPFPALGSIGLGEGGYVTQVQLQQDADRIASFYKSRGFPGVKVRSEVARDPAAFDALGVFGAEVTGAGGGHDLYVRFYIDEGRREIVDHVELEFVGAARQERARRLHARCKLGFGARIHHTPRSRTTCSASSTSTRRSGRPYVHDRPVELDVERGARPRRPALPHRRRAGGPLRRDPGARQLQDRTASTIRRDLPFKPGDLFDFTKLEAAERNLQTHLIFNSRARAGAGAARARHLVPVLVVGAGALPRAPTALSRSPSAPPPTGCPTTAYVVGGSYTWSNFLGYRLAARAAAATSPSWRRCSADPITMGASVRYTDVRAFGPGWRFDVHGFYPPRSDGNRFGLITTLRRLDRRHPQPDAGPARASLRYDVYLANINVGFLRLIGSNDIDVGAGQHAHVKVVRRAGLGSPPRRRRARSTRWRRSRAGSCSGSVGYRAANGSTPTRSSSSTGRRIGIAAVPHPRPRVHAHGQPALRRTASPSTTPALPLVERFYAGGDTHDARLRHRHAQDRDHPHAASSPLRGTAGFRVVARGRQHPRPQHDRAAVSHRQDASSGCRWPWVGAVFWDMGAIVNGLGPGARRATSSTSIGISLLRLITPVGPLSVEYAYPLTQTLAEERWKTSPWYAHFPGRIHFNWGIPLSRL